MKKTQVTKKYNRKSGFTLLELLIVVAILAIIGGALLAAYSGLTGIAANGVATNAISSTSQAIRSYEAVEKSLPDGLESLIAAGVTSSNVTHDGVSDSVASEIDSGSLTNMLGSKLAGKLGVANLSYDQVKSLTSAGIDSIRYIDSAGDDETASDLTIADAAGTSPAAGVGKLSEISIPTHAFAAPRPGSSRNRGRGFALDLEAVVDAQGDAEDTAASGVRAAIWDMSASDGTTGVFADYDIDEYDNVKVTASPTAILVCLGVGNDSNLVASDSNVKYLANAPIYGKVERNEYAHYIAMFDVSGSEAKFVAVIDSRGDFLDEEFAEATGQKQ